MRIAIDISQIAHEGTGIETYTDQLVRNLLTIDSQNDYLLFGISLRKFDKLTDYFAEIKSLNKNVSSRFFHIPPKAGEFLWNRLHLVNMENLIDDIDIFHSSDWIQPPCHAKKITTIHDVSVYKYPEVSHPYIVEAQKRRLKWVRQECDKVLADSIATKDDIINLLQIEEEKIEVAYPGISEKFTPASSAQIATVKQKYGLFDDYILAVGTIEPRKNLKGVIAAFEQFMKHTLIVSRKKPVELVVVGKFGWGEKLQNSKFVKTLGFVDESDLPGLYSGASIFVYPSFYEGFGFPVLEAMSCGCPVITSNRGSLEEIAGSSSLLVDPELSDDIVIKMTQLFVDSDLRCELIEKGKKNAQKYRWEKTAREVLNIYNKLL